jgi:hypothetical protein
MWLRGSVLRAQRSAASSERSFSALNRPGEDTVAAPPPSILADYPYLDREDVLEALRYAAWLAEERQIDIANA